MLVDLHTHTTASDGVLSPVELVQRAEKSGVQVLAITDHDTVAGFKTAAKWCDSRPDSLRLVSGIEYSCRWSGVTLHVVGLGMNCEHPAMVAGLQHQAKARSARSERIGEQLEKRGFSGALAGARAVAGSSQLGRPHFARWLVEQGHLADERTAFDRYLGAGKAGDVKAFWPDLAEVVAWISDAGGIAVLAHPLKYRLTGTKLRRLLGDFIGSGGRAVEIRSGRQSRDDVAHLLRLATSFDLLVSAGSDFHRDAGYSAPIGVDVSSLLACPNVWDVLEPTVRDKPL